MRSTPQLWEQQLQPDPRTTYWSQYREGKWFSAGTNVENASLVYGDVFWTSWWALNNRRCGRTEKKRQKVEKHGSEQ